MQYFLDTMGMYTLIGLAVEVALLIALVPALVKVCQWRDSLKDNHEDWLYQIRDLRKQLHKTKDSVEVTKIQLPSILSSGPMKLILPLALRFL